MEEATTDILSQVFSAGRIGRAVALVVLAWLVLSLFQRVISALATYLPRRRQAFNRLVPIVRILVWSVVVYVVVARILAPPRETLLAVAASGGLALGLAGQDLVKNVISGLLLLFEQSYQVGDVIAGQGVRGEVV